LKYCSAVLSLNVLQLGCNRNSKKRRIEIKLCNSNHIRQSRCNRNSKKRRIEIWYKGEWKKESKEKLQ